MNWSHLMQLLNERTDRRTVRGMIADHLSSFLRFGEVVATKVVSGTGLRADVDVDGTVPRQETYAGQAGFLSRPQDGAEVVAWVSGDEAIVIATKDRRFEVALENGEVVMHNMPSGGSAQQTTLRIKDDGTVEIQTPPGKLVNLGDAEPSSFVALATKVNSELTKVKATLDSLTGGSGAPAEFTVQYVRSDVDATKVKSS